MWIERGTDPMRMTLGDMDYWTWSGQIAGSDHCSWLRQWVVVVVVVVVVVETSYYWATKEEPEGTHRCCRWMRMLSVLALWAPSERVRLQMMEVGMP